MIPTLALREQAMKLLAADPTTLAPAVNAIHMALVMTQFVPAESTVITDFTLATFDGSTPLDVTVGTQPEGLDPATNDAIIDLSAPIGGFRWETTGVTNLPQTIYGFALIDHANALLLACELLPSPVTLTAVNQRIDVGDARLTQRANSIT
jgi:hypothetical protein